MGAMLDRSVLSGEHDALLVLMEDLMTCIAAPAADAEQVARIRWQMTRVLLAHLAKEDALLYPSLKSGRDARVAAMASRFSDEMGDLAMTYRTYVASWTAERIVAEWPAFGADTRRMMQALARRIEREETSLYPLIPYPTFQRSAA